MAKRRRWKTATWSYLPQGRDWFTPKRPWLPGIRFEDGETERVIDPRMPARPTQAGNYGSAALRCIDSPLAEFEYEHRTQQGARASRTLIPRKKA
jgi:hypothetical protein